MHSCSFHNSIIRIGHCIVNLHKQKGGGIIRGISFRPDAGRFRKPISRQHIVFQSTGSRRILPMPVWDNGCGIASVDIDKLFDPFFSNKFTGRGLGLPAIFGIVKAHHGVVTVESEVGQGTTVKVFFPMFVIEAPHLPAKAPQSLAVEGGGTVLLVEDDAMVRKMAAIMLARLGYDVLTANDGVEALEEFKNHLKEVRVVVSDLSMPRMGGWETLAALRQLRPNLPVILASGYDESTVLAGNHPELPQVFLHKPYQKVGLKNAIARAIWG